MHSTYFKWSCSRNHLAVNKCVTSLKMKIKVVCIHKKYLRILKFVTHPCLNLRLWFHFMTISIVKKMFVTKWNYFKHEKGFWSYEKPGKHLQCWGNQFWGPCYDNQIITGLYKVTHTLYFNYYTEFFSGKLSLEILLEQKLGTRSWNIFRFLAATVTVIYVPLDVSVQFLFKCSVSCLKFE